MKTLRYRATARFFTVDEQRSGIIFFAVDNELLNNYIRIRGITFARRFDAPISNPLEHGAFEEEEEEEEEE